GARLPSGAVAAPAGLAVRAGRGGHARRHRAGHAPRLLGHGRHRGGRPGRLGGPGRPPPPPPSRQSRSIRPCPRRGATMTNEADLLIVRAPVWTRRPAPPWADAVGARGGPAGPPGPRA